MPGAVHTVHIGCWLPLRFAKYRMSLSTKSDSPEFKSHLSDSFYMLQDQTRTSWA